jgi:hypothetical protein
MKSIKDELQNIILRDGPAGETSQLKKPQSFFIIYAEASFIPEKQQPVHGKEASASLAYDGNFDIFLSAGHSYQFIMQLRTTCSLF